MRPSKRQELFENVVRLRRAERDRPDSDISLVREDLERDLGDTVSRNLAAQFLGVSHTALNRWIKAGDIGVVLTPEGRREVPVAALYDLYESVNEQRRSGRRRLHTLEPAIKDARARAMRMRPQAVLAHDPEPRDRHRTADLRSLAYHRAIARRLRRPMVDDASRLIRRWEVSGKIDRRYANKWDEVLRKPVSEIREIISADNQDARDLRQNSPFAGLLSEPERRKILEAVI